MKRNSKRNKIFNLNNFIYLCCTVISFLYLSKMAEPSLGARWIMLNLLAIVLPFITIGKAYFSGKSGEFKLSRMQILIIILAIWFLISGLWSVNKANYIQEIINHLSIFLLILFISYYALNLDFKVLFRLLSLIVFALSLLGILQFYGLDFRFFQQAVPPASTFVNKNLATTTIALLFPLTYIQLLCMKNSKTWKILLSASCSITLAYLIAAGTRSAWLGTAISMIVLFIVVLIKSDLRKFLTRNNILHVFIAIIIAILLVSIGSTINKKPVSGRSLNDQIETMSTLLDSIDIHNSTNSINMRLIKWRNALEMFKANPLTGFGLGNFDANYPLFHNSGFEDRNYDSRLFIAELHNEPLQYLVETGLIGIVLISIFLLSIYVMLFRLLKTENHVFALIIFTGISTLIIDSFFNHSFHYPTAIFWFCLFSGMVISKYNQEFPKNLAHIKTRKILLPAMILFLILTVSVINISNRKYRSSVLYRKALIYDRAEQTIPAVQFVSQSVDAWQNWNVGQFHCARILARNYLLKKTNKNFQMAKEYNDSALKNMPFNYLLNLMKFKILLAGGTSDDLKALEKDIPLLQKIMPYSNIYDVYDLLQQYYEKTNNPEQALHFEFQKNKQAGDAYFEYGKFEKSLKYYKRLTEKFNVSEEIEERIEFLRAKKMSKID
ncbi:MAG: O-antigen ligase [Candidatus Cloacimonadales bacterium]|nr:O-antigen ligase [Candidatus Cloacimonadales bacterium]